jgi:protoporphyrinogen/coproporphyrinogen III oxidase
VSGLAAAIDLEKSGREVLLLEERDEAGGALRSHRADGWVFEDGPTSVLDLDGRFRAFCTDLGIESEIVRAGPDVKRRYLFHEGKLESVPSGPTDFMKTPLLTFGERLRFMRESFVAAGPEGKEESVSAFVARRFGDRVAAKYAAAVVSGVFAGDPDRLSIDAAFPEVRAIEREHGSLLRGAAAMAGKRGGSQGGLVALAAGLGRIGEAARARLGARLRTRTRVDAIERGGGRLALAVTSGDARERIEADACILATPAAVAATLLRPFAGGVADGLAGIEHASLAVMQLGFRTDDLPGLPAGFGFLVPRGAGLESLGWIFLSHVFAGRAPPGHVALLGFFGGTLAPRALGLDDRGLGELAVREIGRAIQAPRAGEPAFLRVVRWKNALPQYNLGHRERIRDVMSSLERACPELVLAGNYLKGISMPRSLESGSSAAAALGRRPS